LPVTAFTVNAAPLDGAAIVTLPEPLTVKKLVPVALLTLKAKSALVVPP